MAWTERLLDCTFRGIPLEVLATRDAFSKALSLTELPYVDGARVDDMGANATHFNIQAIFFGDDYEDRLFAALDAFNEKGSGQFYHPVYGLVERAQVASFEVTHNAPEPDACTVSVELVEDGAPILFFNKISASKSIQDDAGAASDSLLDQASNALADAVAAIKANNPLAALDNLRKTALGPLLEFSRQVNGIITSGLSILDSPRAWARDLSALADGILLTVSFGDRLMQDWNVVTGAFSSVAGKFGFGAEGASSSSATTASRDETDVVLPRQFIQAVAAAPVWRPGTPPTEAQVAARVNVYLSILNATSFSEAGAIVLAAEQETPTLSPAELETVVNTARHQINAAMATARAVLPLEQSRPLVETLKTLAAQLQSAGQDVIEQRPPLLMRAAPAPGNYRLIAHLWYGDHTRAGELHRLNGLRLPNAIQQGELLRAYAQ